ncbi:tyrosine-protein phosphatase [Streptomyces sp. NPDC053427]|uniref:tyrosine-protein phosphatase n=1 Tax=Streptomyces sp. NPDC053427 TaxID=3365701 RepID=UPI0037D13EB1
MKLHTRAVVAAAVTLAVLAPVAPAAAEGHGAPSAIAGAHPRAGRVLAVPGLVNARDIGGYATYDGKSTRWGVAYRTESLSKLTADGVAALAGLGLDEAIDLRTGPEVQADGADQLPAGVTSVPLAVDDTSLFAFMGQVVRSKDPVYQEQQLGGGKAEERMESLYRGFVTNSANRAALGAAVKRIASSSKPVLFHCSSGKDRTGVLAFSVLRAVGVPESTAQGDYLLSNALRAGVDKALRDQVKAAGYMENPDLLIPLQEVRREYLAAFVDEATADYGSFGKFLTAGLGLDAATLAKLRGRLVG